jgi:hypothetical protein
MTGERWEHDRELDEWRERFAQSLCSGVVAAGHDPAAPTVEYRIALRVTRHLCPPCADAAARLGLIDRRESDRDAH